MEKVKTVQDLINEFKSEEDKRANRKEQLKAIFPRKI